MNSEKNQMLLIHGVRAKLLQSCPAVCNPMDCWPTWLLCPWDSPGKNTGVSSHSPGDLPDPGIEAGSPTLQADSLPSEPPGGIRGNYVLL